MKRFQFFTTGLFLLLLAVSLISGCGEDLETYTITYHPNGADSGEVPEPVSVLEGGHFNVSGNTGNLLKEGHVLTGWNKYEDGSGKLYVLNATADAPGSDTDIYAEWVPVDPDFTFVIDGTAKLSAYTGTAAEVVIPSSFDGIEVTEICDQAFTGNATITGVTIPDSVTTIGYRAFYMCYNLTAITIPGSVTGIGEGAFHGCNSLTGVTIPAGVTVISDYAFCDCDAITAVTIPDSVTVIGDNAFYACNVLEDVTIGKSVTTIGYRAFYWCRAITGVTIPDSVTSIGDEAFSMCSALTDVTIPDSVTGIGCEAFWACSFLEDVTIGNSVTFIGGDAFESCSRLINVTVNAAVPPETGVSIFNYCDVLNNIYVPSDSVDDYKGATGWSDYSSIIQGL